MKKIRKDFGEIKEFYGGSLSSIEVDKKIVIKKYNGDIYRGYEKLREEYKWYFNFPKLTLSKFPKCIPTILDFKDDSNNSVELYLSLIDRTSMTKSILKGQISPEKTKVAFQNALKLLTNYVYPNSSNIIGGRAIFQLYHAKRFNFAYHYLKSHSEINELITSNKIIINEIECPSILDTFKMITSNAPTFFNDSNLVFFHGNFHLDNILVDLKTEATIKDISFIDPRGDIIGPAHYDFSKVLLSLEGYYDEINYNGFEVKHKKEANYHSIDLKINLTKSDFYLNCLQILFNELNAFAEIEKISKTQFYLSVLASEWIHVFSFLFYHQSREPKNKKKIIAFIAILGLLSKRITHALKDQILPNEIERLKIN